MSMADRLAARVRGSGSPVFVLAHGLGGTQDGWEPIARDLAKDATVITFDLAGSGASDPSAFDPRRHASILGFADDLAGLVADMGARGGIYVGHSMSGMAGALAAAADPDLFSDLVLLCASACYIDHPAEGYVGGFSEEAIEQLLAAVEADFTLWSSGFAPYVMGNSDRPEFAREFTRTLQQYPPAIAHTAMRAAFMSDFRAYMPRVSNRCLVLQSHDDPAVPLEAARWLAGQLPNAELGVLQSRGHFPHVVAPTEVVAAIRGWLHGDAP